MEKFKEQIKTIFNQTRKISCPAFNGENVYFNAKGINHLMYKGNRSGREENRIKTNIRLLPRAIKLLKLSSFWQEENRYMKDKRTYRFWAFEAVIDDVKIFNYALTTNQVKSLYNGGASVRFGPQTGSP